LLNVADSQGREGETLVFTVTLSAPVLHDVRATFATSDWTAQAPGDYQTTSGALILPAGAQQVNLPVNLVDDILVEGDETLTLTLGAPTGALLGQAQATGAILDNDRPVTPQSNRLYLPRLLR
jgi:hypothetical protein